LDGLGIGIFAGLAVGIDAGFGLMYLDKNEEM